MTSLISRRLLMRPRLFVSVVPCVSALSARSQPLERHHRLLSLPPPVVVTSRSFGTSLLLCKKKGKGVQVTEAPEETDSDASDDELDADDDDSIEFKEMTLNVSSLRLDVVVAKAFGISRTQAEDHLHKSNIYLNGLLTKKKSEEVMMGDQIDYVVSRADADPDLATVNRILVRSIDPTSVPSKKSFVPLIVRRSSNIITKDYPVPL